MIRKTLNTLVVALVAAFALSSMAEAAAPKKTRHRPKHSSRVSSGALAPAAQTPAAKKRAAARARAHAGTTTQRPSLKETPANRRPTTKPR